MAIGLLCNASIEYCDLSKNDIEMAGGIAIAKVIRINRTLQAINLSFSNFQGQPIREIARSLIVNNELKSINLNCVNI